MTFVPIRQGASDDAAKRAPSRAALSCNHQLENTDDELRGVAKVVAALAAVFASDMTGPYCSIPPWLYHILKLTFQSRKRQPFAIDPLGLQPGLRASC